LKVGRDTGATYTIDVESEDVTEAVGKLTAGAGADAVVDCTGFSAGIAITPELVKPGGTIVMVGMPPTDIVSINVANLIWKEASIVGSFRYDNCFSTVIGALSRGLIDIRFSDYP